MKLSNKTKKVLLRIGLGILFSPILLPVCILGGLVLAGHGIIWVIKYILTGRWKEDEE